MSPAIIITSALLTPLTASAALISPVELSLLIIATAGGVMTVSHADTSLLGVVSQFNGLSPRMLCGLSLASPCFPESRDCYLPSYYILL